LVPLLALPRQGDPRGSAAGIDPQLYRRHGFFDPVLEDDREGFPAIDRRLALPQEHPRPGRSAGAQWFLVGVHYKYALQNLSFNWWTVSRPVTRVSPVKFASAMLSGGLCAGSTGLNPLNLFNHLPQSLGLASIPRCLYIRR